MAIGQSVFYRNMMQKKNYAILWGTVSSKRIKLQSHTTSHFKDLEKTFPTIIRFLIFLNVKGEKQSTLTMTLK